MDYGLLLLSLLIMHFILTRGPETLLLLLLLVFLMMLMLLLLLLRRIGLHSKIWIHLWCCHWKLSFLTATVRFTSFRPNWITAGWGPGLTGMHCHCCNYIIVVALLKLLLLLIIVMIGQCHATHLLRLIQSLLLMLLLLLLLQVLLLLLQVLLLLLLVLLLLLLLLLLPVWLNPITLPTIDLIIFILIPLRVLLLLVRPVCFLVARKCFLLLLEFIHSCFRSISDQNLKCNTMFDLQKKKIMHYLFCDVMYDRWSTVLLCKFWHEASLKWLLWECDGK